MGAAGINPLQHWQQRLSAAQGVGNNGENDFIHQPGFQKLGNQIAATDQHNTLGSGIMRNVRMEFGHITADKGDVRTGNPGKLVVRKDPNGKVSVRPGFGVRNEVPVCFGPHRDRAGSREEF